MRQIEETDLVEVKQWLEKRKNETIDIDISLLPLSGLIEPGICALFWLTTNANILILSDFVVNPESSRAERERSAKTMASIVFILCQELRIKRVIAFSRKASIEHYIELTGFPNIQCMGEFKLYRWDNVGL